MTTAKCTIYQAGIPAIDTPQAIECMIAATQESIKSRLLELQMGYWQQGDKKPKVKVITLTPDSVLVKADSDDIDWHYVARIKKSIWDKIKQS
jgi:hypothetical protein